MSKLLITTQVYENYAWREDGTIGTGAEAYWKAKGGNDYVIRNIDVNRARELADAATREIEQANDYFTETVIGWEIVGDDYLTEFEQSQLEYDGAIVYPARVLELVVA
jgi:hypothetical protein